MLAPADALELGVDYRLLGGLTESLGTAGVVRNYTEFASIAFTDPGRFIHVYHVDLEIASSSPQIMELPSLLGREILDRWRMVYEPAKSTLSFSVRSADVTLRV